MNVGFVGLGRMGSGMAGRILDAGHDLAVYDVMPQNTAKAAAAGARVASSLADLCAGREVVITMLAEDAAVHAVVLGEGGLRDSLPAGAIHLAMGTYGIGTIRTLAAAHKTLVPALVTALHEAGGDDILIVVGGVVPGQDYEFLKQAGAAAVFGPGTVIAQAARQVLQAIRERRGVVAAG